MDLDLSLLSSLRGEFKTDDYIQPHYKEAYRLAIDRLLSGGRDCYQEFLKGERVGTFLSDDELAFIVTHVEQTKTHTQTEETNVQNQIDSQSSSGTYWPMHSDVDTPDLDLGWPDVKHEKLQTNVDLLFHPPRQNNPTIKEVIRKHIQAARQVIAVVMDKFTDVDILKEIVEASLRGVAVYVLLDHFHLKSFLSMVENQDVRIPYLKNMRVRTVKGQDYLCQSGAKFHGAMEQRFLLVDCCTAFYGSYSFAWSFEKINLSMVQVITGHLVKSYDEEFRTLYARSTVPTQLIPLASPLQQNGLHGRPIIPKPVPAPGPKLERGGQLRHTMDAIYRKSYERSQALTDLEEGLAEKASLGPLKENGISAHMSEMSYKKRHSYAGAGERQEMYISPNIRPRGSNWNISDDSGKNFALDNLMPAAQIRGQPKRQVSKDRDKQLSAQPITPHPESSKAFMRTWRIESYLSNTDTPLRESCDYLDQLDPLGKVNTFMQGRMRTSLVLRSTIPEQAELDSSSLGLGPLSPNTAMHYSSMQWSPTATDRNGRDEFSFRGQSLQVLDDNENLSPTRGPYNSNYASLGRQKSGHILTNTDLFTENWHKRHSVADPRSNSNYIHEEQLYAPLARMQVNRSSMGINAPNGGYLSALNENQRSVSHYDVKNITAPQNPNSPIWQNPPSRALSAVALDVNTDNVNSKGSSTNKQHFFKKSSKKIKALLNIQNKKDEATGTLGRDSGKSEESASTLTLEDEMRRSKLHHSTGKISSDRHRNQLMGDPLATSIPRFTTEEHRYHPHYTDVRYGAQNVRYDPQKLNSPDRNFRVSYETGSLRRDYSIEQRKYSRYEPPHNVNIPPGRSTSGQGSRVVQDKDRISPKDDAFIEHYQAAQGNQENKIGKFFQRVGNLINKNK